MKKITLLLITALLSTFSYSQPQPSLGDLQLEIDQMNLNDVSGSYNAATTSYNNSVNSLLNDLDVIKNNNIPNNPNSQYQQVYLNCPCGEKNVTINVSYTDYSQLRLLLINDVGFSTLNIPAADIKEDAKQYLARILNYLQSRNIKLTNVIKLEVIFSATVDGDPNTPDPYYAVGVKITYRTCAPCGS
jgi:hypothetical protein